MCKKVKKCKNPARFPDCMAAQNTSCTNLQDREFVNASSLQEFKAKDGWSSEHPGLMESVSLHGKRWKQDDL